jgi:hypothetical protein
MERASLEKIADIILGRREVYNIDTDSRLREAANRLTAKAFLELFDKIDDQSPEFHEVISKLLANLPVEGPNYMIGFQDQMPDDTTPESEPETEVPPISYYLRLVFANEDAAYYQFPLFPDLNAPYIRGAARKRSGAIQHLRLDLSSSAALQTFIEDCRKNPHFLRIEQSTADEFMRAPSNSV